MIAEVPLYIKRLEKDENIAQLELDTLNSMFPDEAPWLDRIQAHADKNEVSFEDAFGHLLFDKFISIIHNGHYVAARMKDLTQALYKSSPPMITEDTEPNLKNQLEKIGAPFYFLALAHVSPLIIKGAEQ